MSRVFLLAHRLCPVALDDCGTLVVAVADDAPPYADAAADLSLRFRRPVRCETRSWDEIAHLIERSSAATDAADAAQRADGARASAAADRDLASQPPVVRYVQLLLREAIANAASDVHLEPHRDRLAARYRIDGKLMPAIDPARELARAVVSRLKILADLDIAEQRRPQDGRIRFHADGRDVDVRVSVVPTALGEGVVLRLLDRGAAPVSLAELGMPEPVRSALAAAAFRPHGLVLVTGPTGSGKTTTLYSCLRARAGAAEKLVTIEDPVEYQLPGVSQVPVGTGAGVTFASALRAILRHDPDVIMVGEMRDAETAETTIQAALTGHLVFSTLHTNDAVAAVPRLLDLGVPGYLVAATVDCIVAQRLVRRVCARCAAPDRPPQELLERLRRADGEQAPDDADAAYVRGTGCADCRGTGFRGRVGLYECLTPSEACKDAIASGAGRAELRAVARASGWEPLARDAWRKVREGITTVEEALGALQA